MVFDVICVGGGLAGLVAAVRAAELGKRVCVLEAGSGAEYACNSRISGGIFHAAYHDVTASADVLEKGMRAAGATSDELIEAVAGGSARAFAWLRGQGVRFAHIPHIQRGAWIMAPPRPLLPGLADGAAWKGRGPDLALRLLTERLTAAGGRLCTGVRVRELAMRDGRCTGVVARTARGHLEHEARAVVLADGGFGGNEALIRRHIGPSPARLLKRGAGTGFGDALEMATAVGALAAGLDRFYGHLVSRDALGNASLWPYPILDAIAAISIIVGPDGRRWVDEGKGGISAANQLAALPQPDGAAVIFDSPMWNGPGRAALVPPNPMLVRHGATIYAADSIRALARAASLPQKQLEDTVEDYNKAVAAGTVRALTPSRSDNKVRPSPIAVAPFFAVPIVPGITYTMGGIAINACAQAVSDTGPIEGLYAAGSCTGGLEGGDGATYVGGLIKAVLFGMLAAEHASGFLAPARSPEKHARYA